MHIAIYVQISSTFLTKYSIKKIIQFSKKKKIYRNKEREKKFEIYSPAKKYSFRLQLLFYFRFLPLCPAVL